MRLAGLGRLIVRDIRRARGALGTAAFGIFAGTSALCFFLGLGLGVRGVLLGQIPIDKLELEPEARPDRGLLALMLGSPWCTKHIPANSPRPASTAGSQTRLPQAQVRFPCSARGGAELFGHDVGSSEMLGDGIDPRLLTADANPSWKFEDPWDKGTMTCASDSECQTPQYCEKPISNEAGRCTDPVPVFVSRYLVEIFNRGIAPAHGLPPVGDSLLSRASGVTFNIRLGDSLLGKSKQGSVRVAKARIVGVSSRAIDLGLTLPLGVVQRWNSEFSGAPAATSFSSVLVETTGATASASLINHASKLGLVPKDTRARDVGILVNGVMGLLSIVSMTILLVSASNIAYTFRALLQERRAEIGLYRAVGATHRDILLWIVSLAASIGVIGSCLGLLVARLAALGADWLASSRLPDFPFKPDTFFAFPWWMILGTILFGTLFAVLGAVGPARRAAQTDPRESLLS